jgi:hypothetical protein
MVVREGTFRSLCDEYVSMVCCIRATRKQSSPFIVISNDTITGVDSLSGLLGFPDDSLVFHTWSGQYRADVFHYRLGDARSMFSGKIKL